MHLSSPRNSNELIPVLLSFLSKDTQPEWKSTSKENYGDVIDIKNYCRHTKEKYIPYTTFQECWSRRYCLLVFSSLGQVRAAKRDVAKPDVCNISLLGKQEIRHQTNTGINHHLSSGRIGFRNLNDIPVVFYDEHV